MQIQNPVLTGSLTLNGLNITTGNLVTTGSNVFVGNQTITGSVAITGSGGANTLDIVGRGANSAVNPPRGTVSLYYDGVDGATAGVHGSSIIFSQRYNAAENAPIGVGMITGVKVNSGGNFGGGLTFWTSNQTANNLCERVRIDASGNMGIGLREPTALLHLSSSQSASLFRVSSNANANVFFISGSGNVGIGTASPSSVLTVSGSTLITGSLGVTGPITGSAILSTGRITAQTLVVSTISSSVTFSSGSNIFGNSTANTQTMTGSVNITGSLTITTAGTSPEFQVVTGGTIKGNALTDVHQVTGSLFTTGSTVCFSPLLRLSIDTSTGSPITAYSSIQPSGFDFNTVCSTGNRAVRIYATNTLAASPNGAAIQFFSSDHSAFCGQFYIDSGANNNAALIFRTAVTSGNITERMRITATGVACFSCQVCAPMFLASACIGINNSSPSQRLDIGSGHIKLSDGYGLFYGTQTQVYASEASKYVRFDIAGTSGVMFLSGSGNVGIGTTSPSTQLHVNSSSDTTITIDSGGTSYQSILSFVADSERAKIIGGYNTGGGGYLAFNTDSTGGSDVERMRITSGGNVGIGTTPCERFEVAGITSMNIRLYGRSGVAQNNLSSNIYYNGTVWTRDNLSYGAQVIRMDTTNGGFYIDADNTTSGYPCTRFFICAANGNVGIGTCSPTNNLVVQTSTANGGIDLNYAGSTYARFAMVNPGTSNDTYIGSFSNNAFRIYSNSTERMRFANTGEACFACTVCSPRFIGSSIITFTGLPTSDQTTACRSIEGLWSLASNRSCATKAGQYGNGTWYVQGGTNAGCWIYYKFAIQNPVWFRAYVYLVNYSDTSLRKGCMQYSLDNSGTWTDMANATNWQFNGTLDGNVSLSGDTKIITVRWDSGGSGNLVGWNNVEFTGCGSAFYSINGLG